jgi:uncharacterized protein (UPF0371 family)
VSTRSGATPWRGEATERGSVSVVAAVVIGIALICTMGVADVAKALVARAHAHAAADAAEYAGRNGGTIVSCDCVAGATEATVRVSLLVGSLLLLADDRSVTAAARAVVDVPGS